MTFLKGVKGLVFILCEKMGKIRNLNVSDIVGFSINLLTKCVFLVMFRPPPPTLYAFVCISVDPPTPP